MGKEYYLGLDMGTSSVGWAVTDENYNLLRAKGKDLWGVRLFSEAKTAADRRTMRTSRRRLQREKARINLLRGFFAEEIAKVDPGFFQRLEDSKYYSEDKKEHQPFALFADTGYTDKQYFEQYPTIFHLRKELLESKEVHDVRLVYLAVLNMFKHRGHFLNGNIEDEGIGNLSELCESLQDMLLEYNEIEINGKMFAQTLEKILPSKNYSNSVKAAQILEALNVNKAQSKSLGEMVKLICGLKGKLTTAFSNDSFDEEGKKASISYRDSNFETACDEVEDLLSEEAFEIFLVLKQIHDWGILANIMKGQEKTYEFLSLARVDSYEKHKKDLSILKKLVKEYAPEKYDSLFRVMEDNNYSAYVGSVHSGKNVCRRGAKSGEFINNVKKMVAAMPETEETQYVLQEIDKETFLPKQLTSSNGVIPNQIHGAELKRILQNAENYLPFLKEKDERGLTVSEKILALFKFQIPYYVGPLVNRNGKNSWVVRKENGAVYPWNFEEKVDTKASAEKFIERMVNDCTYLSGENVLPKNSLLYEKFMVLNELNNLCINGEKIKVEVKQALYHELFRKGKKVKNKDVEKFLKNNGYVDKNDEIGITGIDGDFTNTLSNYAKFAAIFQVDTLTYEQEKIAEQIIFWSTVYGDSRKFLKERIEEEYSELLSKEQIKRILGFKFKDWGRLSKALLTLEGADRETGEISTIISRMWNENYNLMELLSNKFTYLNEIKAHSKNIEKTLSEIEYEDLSELYISSPVKRMIWQTILVLKELQKVLGTEPKKIFIEMARDAQTVKERKDSRKKKFAELYKNCKEEGRNWSKEIADKEESEFRSKKLYLYYTQKGRCMYSGKPIELSDLFNDNLYDIDHIYPRHFVKDDSIENNLVLVKKEINAHKKDNLLAVEIRDSRRSWWKSLRAGGFITEEKFKRLTRNSEFTDEERATFISRQIVETRQGTKVIANLFNQTFKGAEVVYVKAGNVSAFRQKFDLIKCREVNDFHHAKDAYLNVVVGNTYHVKFTSDPMNFMKEYRNNPQKNQYHMYRIFDFTVVRNGETAWKVGTENSIDTVKGVMKKNSPLISRMSYEEHGGLADQTIYSAKEAEKAKGVGYLPIKASDEKLCNTSRYGGFKKYTGAYFFLVEHTQKKERVRTIEAMPLYLKGKLDTIEKIEEYCKDELGYVNPVVRLEKIKMYSLIKVDGFYLYLTGRSNAQLFVSNAVELTLSYEQELYAKLMGQAIERKLDNEQLESEGITQKDNIAFYDFLIEKYTTSIYSKRPNSIGKKLQEERNRFMELNLDRQVFVLTQILQLSKLSNTGANLIDINGAKKAGTMKLNKCISGTDEFKLIHTSATGLYRKEIDLLTV